MQPSRDISRLDRDHGGAAPSRRAAAPGTSSRISRPSATTRSRKPTRSPTPSSARTSSDLRDELGDLLLQPVYHAQMAAERGLFDIGDVVEAITTKLIRRHPHVFGDRRRSRRRAAPRPAGRRSRPPSARQRPTKQDGPASSSTTCRNALPALARAEKLAKRAARVGFDWPDTPSGRRQGAGGVRRDRGRDRRRRQGRDPRRARRPADGRRQPRAAARRRCRGRAARRQRQVHPPLPPRRGAGARGRRSASRRPGSSGSTATGTRSGRQASEGLGRPRTRCGPSQKRSVNAGARCRGSTRTS